MLPWHNFLSGPTSWNEDEYRRYFARMKAAGLNYVAFHCYTGGAERYALYVEPTIRMKFKDVVPEAAFDTSLTARWGYRPLAVADFAFDTARLFQVPVGGRGFGSDCAVLATDREDRYRRAQGLMRQVFDMAREQGLQTGLGFEFGVHPPEFASIVPPESWIRGAMLPDPTHPANIEILRSTLDNILETYPRLDWLWLWLHEHTMYVGKAQPGDRFRALLGRHAQFFSDAGSEDVVFSGVWSLAYVRLVQSHLAQRGSKVRLVLSGWGGGNQVPGVLRGLDRVLPRDVVFSCLNPDQGWSPQPAVLGEIARRRDVWAIPWLEGDEQLWHLQPRVNLLRSHLRLARDQKLQGVLAIHWRTEETRGNFEAFAQYAANPLTGPTVEEFYKQFVEPRFGTEAAVKLAPALAQLDRSQSLGSPSPEYFPYDPHWGRLRPAQRPPFEQLVATVQDLLTRNTTPIQQEQLNWLLAKFQFTLLLDEVSRGLEPAFQLKDRWLRGEVVAAQFKAELAAARQALASAPVEALFRTYARSVSSRGELGVLSSLNQKLWLEYLELQRWVEEAAKQTP
jgi:hypothetical protein